MSEIAKNRAYQTNILKAKWLRKLKASFFGIATVKVLVYQYFDGDFIKDTPELSRKRGVPGMQYCFMNQLLLTMLCNGESWLTRDNSCLRFRNFRSQKYSSFRVQRAHMKEKKEQARELGTVGRLKCSWTSVLQGKNTWLVKRLFVFPCVGTKRRHPATLASTLHVLLKTQNSGSFKIFLQQIYCWTKPSLLTCVSFSYSK